MNVLSRGKTLNVWHPITAISIGLSLQVEVDEQREDR